MKKFSIIILSLILATSLAACGRRDNTPTNPTVTDPTRDNSMIPGVDPTIMDPTFETNIPDPSVDTSMPGATTDMTLPNFTDGTDYTESTRDTVR